MGRISRGWALTKASFLLLGNEKQLLLFPLISAFLIIGLFVGFLMLFFFSFFFGFASGGFAYFGAVNILIYVMFFVFYLLATFISKFFNAAVMESAAMRFSGRDATFANALGNTSKKVHKIFLWALLSATIGILLQIIEKIRFGRIIRFIIGLAWGIATFFTLPVLLFEDKGVFSSIKRSIELVKKSWGESLIAVLGTGIIFFLLFLVGLVPLLITVFLGLGVAAVLIVGIATFIYIIIILLLSSVVRNIVVTGLYIYASKGRLSDPAMDKLVRNIEKL